MRGQWSHFYGGQVGHCVLAFLATFLEALKATFCEADKATFTEVTQATM